MLAQDHCDAVEVLSNRYASRGCLEVEPRVSAPSSSRAPAWLSRAAADDHTEWVLSDDLGARADRYAVATLLLDGHLVAHAGATVRARLYPEDWSQWDAVVVGQQIDQHVVPHGPVATARVLARRAPDSAGCAPTRRS
jgi:hypothetical protein